jgi:hypothetical protein
MLSDSFDAKLASVSESLETKLNLVADRLDVKINSMISNATAEIRRENDQIREEFSIQSQTELQLIAKEVEVVRNNTGTELTNRVQNFETDCNKINGSINEYKPQTDSSMNSLRSLINQIREEVENKIGELANEVRSVASGI